MEVPVRVVARVKPSTEEHETCIQVAPAASQIVLGYDNFFDFDAVFGDNVSQKDFYSTCLSDIVANFFHGVNTTVISYGQRGSGKTFTMIGPDFIRAMNEEEFGLLPQAVRDIFKMISKVQELRELEFRVHISYLIINQESVYDLLSRNLATLNVLDDNVGNVVIPGLTVIDCNNISEVLNCLEFGLLQKHSAIMQGFDLSSAHTMFNLTLEHQWPETDGKVNYVCSRISFVDLASCEEIVSSEFNKIGMASNTINDNMIFNSDLKALSAIIYKLTNENQRQNLPYKASRLTHMLKDSFGGNNLTLMICCLSPDIKDFELSQDTLKLGCLARYVINYPVFNIISQNSVQMKMPTSNVWNNYQLHLSENMSSISEGTTFSPISNQLPHLNGGLPPNLRVIQNQSLPPVSNFNKPIVQNNGEQQPKNDDIFRVQFAASQWHQLVSSAENLLAEILQSGSLSPTDKTRIESWLCMKAEADDCIGTEVPPLQTRPENNRPLEVIEELSEPNDVSDSVSVKSISSTISEESEVSSSISSIGDEFYDRLETLKEKFLTLTTNLIRETEEKYDSCGRLRQEVSLKNTKNEKIDEENTSNRRLSESVREGIESMVVSTSSSASSSSLHHEDDLKEKENLEDSQSNEHLNFENSLDEQNLGLNFEGSQQCLLSKDSSKPNFKRKGKVVSKLRSISGRGKTGFSDSLTRPLGPLTGHTNSSTNEENSLHGDSVTEDNQRLLQHSSERELLNRVSSKFVSVSKGSSKYVEGLKNKSCQLKRSIRSHIFKKRNKNIHPEIEMSELSTPLEMKPCSVRRVSDELREAQQRLKEIEATIKVKEAFIVELKRNGNEAAAARRKCQTQIERLEEELNDVRQLYVKAQDKMMEMDDNVESKNIYRAKVDNYCHQINSIQKRLSSLHKVASISQQSDSKVKDLEESIKDLREQQEELHTQLRQEMQRKQQLEQQILREERCARNPLCSSKLLDDESEKEDELIDFPIPSIPNSKVECDNINVGHSKKRKLVNSTGDSQNSWKGEGKSGRGRHKAGRLDQESQDGHSLSNEDLILDEETGENFIRKEIDILRSTKDAFVRKRQKIDKKIRKGRIQEDGREEERKLLELDEVVEGLDSIIELKNGIISGKITCIEPYSPILAKHDLEERLRQLPIEELHFLLIKYFDRVIDLRIEFRRHELAFAELENQFDEQNRYISNLKSAYQQASLEMERRLVSLQREYQYKISYLLRQFNEDSTGNGVHEMKLLDLEQQVYYYKKLSRELKEKFKQYLSQGTNNRHSEAVPGPSGIKNQHTSNAPIPDLGIFPQTAPRQFVPSYAAPDWPRRGRRFAVHSTNTQTKVTREKNKIIIQQKGDKHS